MTQQMIKGLIRITEHGHMWGRSNGEFSARAEFQSGLLSLNFSPAKD